MDIGILYVLFTHHSLRANAALRGRPGTPETRRPVLKSFLKSFNPNQIPLHDEITNRT